VQHFNSSANGKKTNEGESVMETLQTEWTSEDKTIQRLSDYKKMAADRIRDLEQRIDELEESLIAERQEVNRARRQFQIIKEIAELNS